MPWPSRVLILLVALLALAGVLAPPVIEDHADAGFCSADCPVQHDGHATAIAAPPPAIARRAAADAVVASFAPAFARAATGSPDAPRAPPRA